MNFPRYVKTEILQSLSFGQASDQESSSNRRKKLKDSNAEKNDILTSIDVKRTVHKYPNKRSSHYHSTTSPRNQKKLPPRLANMFMKAFENFASIELKPSGIDTSTTLSSYDRMESIY
ncbi:hypothetical protein Trydic_g19048 [Trypoxylus dichotomus]